MVCRRCNKSNSASAHHQVFTKYNTLLTSENYVTRRQSLKLLGEILLDRSNFEIMMKYIG